MATIPVPVRRRSASSSIPSRFTMLSSVHQRIDNYLFRDGKDGFIALSPPRHSANKSSPASTARSVARNAWLLTNCSWTNLLLPLVPFALASGRGNPSASNAAFKDPTLGAENPALTFWLNYFAILSLIGLFRYASESLSMAARHPIRDAWNVTFGAFSLDLEVAMIAMYDNQLDLVKAYIVGKVVSTLLLTLGASFIASGLLRSGSYYNLDLANVLSVLLATAMCPFAILAVFPASGHSAQTTNPILVVSRGASFVLLGMYLVYQHFQKTHMVYYKSDSTPSTPCDEYDSAEEESDSLVSRSSHHSRYLTPVVAVITMLSTVTVAYFCTVPILGRIADKQSTGSKPRLALTIPPDTFFGFCLLPLLAELGELTKIMRLALRDHIDISLEVATEVCTQSVLFTTPVICLVGWAMGVPMSLRLDLLEVISFTTSIWVFNYIVLKGSSDYMHGSMAFGLYLILVLAFYLARWL